MVLDAARAENPSGATPAASAAPAASWMKLRLFMVSSLKHCLVAAALFALPRFILVLWAYAALLRSIARYGHARTAGKSDPLKLSSYQFMFASSAEAVKRPFGTSMLG